MERSEWLRDRKFMKRIATLLGLKGAFVPVLFILFWSAGLSNGPFRYESIRSCSQIECLYNAKYSQLNHRKTFSFFKKVKAPFLPLPSPYLITLELSAQLSNHCTTYFNKGGRVPFFQPNQVSYFRLHQVITFPEEDPFLS